MLLDREQMILLLNSVILASLRFRFADWVCRHRHRCITQRRDAYQALTHTSSGFSQMEVMLHEDSQTPVALHAVDSMSQNIQSWGSLNPPFVSDVCTAKTHREKCFHIIHSLILCITITSNELHFKLLKLILFTQAWNQYVEKVDTFDKSSLN